MYRVGSRGLAGWLAGWLARQAGCLVSLLDWEKGGGEGRGVVLDRSQRDSRHVVDGH